MFEATRQGGVFLTMVYAGLLCGIGYDILRALRRIFGAGRIATAVLDLLFWALAAGVCALTLMRISREPLRLYALLGCAGGMLLYLAGVSELIYACLRVPLRAMCAWRDKIRARRQKNARNPQNSTE